MMGLPTGTVTFLFTDIEDSTRLLQDLGVDRYERLQEKHASILRRAIAGGGGTVVRIDGDSFFAAFPTSSGALQAAISSQRQLALERWPGGAAIRVRMGLHSGMGRLGGGDYVGIDVNRAARIAAAGHGGQVVISEATRGLVEHDLPDGAVLRDLGHHRLKDIAHREHLFDLVIDGLPSEFPTLRTLDVRPNNLPFQLSSFVGRDVEMAETIRLLNQHRLVTLTGPGGTGKTRLALTAGRELLPSFADGVFLVDLASLVDPGQVCPAISRALGVREEPGTDLIDTLVDRVMGNDLLLILDNFEHLLDAGPLVEEVLRRVAGVRVLVTSRTPLGLDGEQELPVPPLNLPDPLDLPALQALVEYDAVALFLDRAREARPGFEVTPENAAPLAEICMRLDGLPLAIELAASRVNVLSPQAILSRLGRRLDLLTTTARHVPERQRTLRGTTDWSYELLEKPERRLFARLSVFTGGTDLEAAEAVCNPAEELELRTLDGVASLVDRGLVRRADTGNGEPRFGMLETIREYAGERLNGDWDGDETRRRHAEYFLGLAEGSERDIVAQDAAGLDRLDLEHDNIQAALRWSIERDEAERGMRAATSIWRFWLLRGHLTVGRTWVDRLLAVPGEQSPVRARAHGAAGSLAYWQQDVAETERHYGEALAMFRDLGDRPGIARALYDLAYLPYVRGTGWDESIEVLREAVELFEELGDLENAAKARGDMAYFTMLLGDLEGALPLLEQALARARGRDDLFDLMDNLMRLAEAQRQLGRLDEARSTLLETLDVVDGADIEGGIAAVLHVLSSLEAAQGRHRDAMRLYGASRAIADSIGGGPMPPLFEDPEANARATIGEEATNRALAEGRAMTRAEAVAYARAAGN
jgi:predicted ATPase/class 3 adenylate cyclase